MTPEKLDLSHTSHELISTSGNTLHLWQIKPIKRPKIGSIIHFHGNAQNMSSHLLFVFWLAHVGFEIITFDYSGYGQSSGDVSRENTIKDGQSVLQWANSRKEAVSEDLFVVGQSLGGAIAITAYAKSQTPNVRALVIESAFASYRDIARKKLASFWLTWPLQYPLSYLVSDEYSPINYVAKIKVPMLFIWGERDPIIPPDETQELFRAATNPKKQIVVPGEHTPALLNHDSQWRRRMVDFLCEHSHKTKQCRKQLRELKEIDNLTELVPERDS